MTWEMDSFNELVESLKLSLNGKSSPVGVPFFIYVYNPKEEKDCIRKFVNLGQGFGNQGFKIKLVYLGKLLATILKDMPYLKPEGKELENKYRENLRKELAHTLPEKISEVLLRGIPGEFEGLRGGEQSEGVFLLRAGSLFPFVHISQILTFLENQTNHTVVIPFPGSWDKQKNKLKFLNETEGAYYRAMIYGG